MPDPKSLHLDAALANLAVLMGQGSFAGPEICPIFPVEKESDKYFIFGNEHFTDDVSQARKGGGTADEVEWSTTTGSYVAREYSLRRLVTDDEVDNADAAIRPFITAQRILRGKLMVAWEKRVKTLATTSGNFGTVNAAGTAWSNAASDPESDIDTAKEGIEAKTGLVANTILIPPAVARNAKRVTKIRDLVRYTQPNLLVNGDLPPYLFNLRVVIPGAINQTTNVAQSSATIARIWNNSSVQVLYVNPNVSVQDASWGITFRHRPFGVNGERVKTYRDEGRGGTFLEYGIKQTEAVLAANCGALITGV